MSGDKDRSIGAVEFSTFARDNQCPVYKETKTRKGGIALLSPSERVRYISTGKGDGQYQCEHQHNRKKYDCTGTLKVYDNGMVSNGVKHAPGCPEYQNISEEKQQQCSLLGQLLSGSAPGTSTGSVSEPGVQQQFSGSLLGQLLSGSASATSTGSVSEPPGVQQQYSGDQTISQQIQPTSWYGSQHPTEPVCQPLGDQAISQQIQPTSWYGSQHPTEPVSQPLDDQTEFLQGEGTSTESGYYTRNPTRPVSQPPDDQRINQQIQPTSLYGSQHPTAPVSQPLDNPMHQVVPTGTTDNSLHSGACMRFAHVGHRHILTGDGYWQKCTKSDEGCIDESSWVYIHASEGRLSETSSGGLLFTNISSEDEGLYRTWLNWLGNWMYYELYVGSKPRIDSQPDDEIDVHCGTTVMFSLEASGDHRYMSYQWSHDSCDLVDRPQKIEGVETSCLVIYAVGREDEGNYQCAVSNLFGSDMTENAVLTIKITPSTSTGEILVTSSQETYYSELMDISPESELQLLQSNTSQWLLNKPQTSCSQSPVLRYETKPSEIALTKASEIAPTEVSEIAPTEGSKMAPNDASEIVPTEGSEISPNDTSEIGFHTSYLAFSHSTISIGCLMTFPIVDMQTESQSDVLQSGGYRRPFVETGSHTESQSHVRPFVEWNPRRRDCIVVDSQTESQTESQSDVLLTQKCMRPVVESNQRCREYELMVSGMQSLCI